MTSQELTDKIEAMLPTAASTLVLCRSDSGDGGWSLHPPGTTDDQIANGDATFLAGGEAKWIEATGEWSRPNDIDYRTALYSVIISSDAWSSAGILRNPEGCDY